MLSIDVARRYFLFDDWPVADADGPIRFTLDISEILVIRELPVDMSRALVRYRTKISLQAFHLHHQSIGRERSSQSCVLEDYYIECLND